MSAGVGAIGERWRFYGLALGEGARRVRRRTFGAVARIAAFGERPPERLLVAPQDLRTTDPTVAADIYAGYFALAGRLVETQGRSPFRTEAPSQAWAEALNGFMWLRHLRAADTAIARANARALVDDFLTQGGDWRGIGVEPRVAARRFISFLSQSPLVLDGADHAFYRRFMRALGRTAGELMRAVAGGLRGEDRLLAIIALAYGGLCLSGPQRLLGRANGLLAEELTSQILPDGGHVSRNPRVLLDMLSDLLPLRQTYGARGLAPPAELVTAIDRMMPMLRLFRHADGALSLFNGMGASAPDLLATLLAYDDVRAQPIEHAPHSGYERLQCGRTVVIADVGAPPPLIFSREAHAGCLSFELSAGLARLIVNCGQPRFAADSVLKAARSTAAHSTVTVADTSSCRFAGAPIGDSLGARLGALIGPAILAGPRDVTAERHTNPRGADLVAAQDGYRRRFGLVQERRWSLDPSGERLEGSDLFSRPNATDTLPAALRFHLHPAVRASRSQGGQTAMLLLPDGEAWAFEAEGLTLALEESVFFAAPDGTRRTEQIVVPIELEHETTVRWRFVRLGRHSPAHAGATGEGEGPE